MQNSLQSQRDLPQLLDEKRAAQLLAVSVAALRRWRREQRGPEFVHLERCVRYPARSLERYLVENLSTNKKRAADRESAAPREVRDEDATTRR